MEHIGIYETRNELSKLIQRVQQGEEFIITNRGEEVAALVSPKEARQKKAMESLAKIRAAFKKKPPGTLEEMIKWSKEGRR